MQRLATGKPLQAGQAPLFYKQWIVEGHGKTCSVPVSKAFLSGKLNQYCIYFSIFFLIKHKECAKFYVILQPTLIVLHQYVTAGRVQQSIRAKTAYAEPREANAANIKAGIGWE